MRSILSNEKKCLVCGDRHYLQEHHIYHGTGKRKISDANGFTCWLCQWHHTGTDGVHGRNYNLDLQLKRMCQLKYEEEHSREEFIALMGKSYVG